MAGQELGISADRLRSAKRKASLRFKTWLAFQTLLPLTAVTFVFLGHLLNGSAHAFDKVFAGGDLVLFSAMLLLGIAIDLLREKETGSDAHSASFDNHWITNLFLGFVFVALYGMVAASTINYVFPGAAGAVADNIRAWSFVCLASAVFASIWGTLSMFATARTSLQILRASLSPSAPRHE